MRRGSERAWPSLPTTADPVLGDRPDQARPLFFVHIPRTGGFTLKHVLQNMCGARHVLLNVHKYDIELVDPSSYEVIEGHVGFSKGERLAGVPNVTTIVREPVARTVSVARNIKRWQTHDRADVLGSRRVAPKDIFAAIPNLSNGQTKQLAGRRPSSDASADDLARARSVVDRIAVGLTEEFSTSLVLLAERFGFRLPEFGVTNASRRFGDRNLRSTAFRELAAEHNQLDQELYAHARAVFEGRAREYVERLRSMSLETGQASGTLEAGGTPAGDVVALPSSATEVRLEGWLLVDGRPADAVIARAGDGAWVPLLSRQVCNPAAWATRAPENLYSGVSGTIPMAAGAAVMSIEAFDRTEGRRATRTVELRRD
jgi:hypothetical protein